MSYGRKYRWEIITTDRETALLICEDLSRRDYTFSVNSVFDSRTKVVMAWSISIFETKSVWFNTIRSELYPVYGSKADFYTANNARNNK